MYISKETIILIIAIAFFVFHMILHVIELAKIHNLKTNSKTSVWETIKAKGKDLLKLLLSPENSIVSAIKEFVTKLLKESENEDGGENG